MNAIVQLAAELSARAQRAEAAAFDQQYELARRAERALAALTAEGQARTRQWAEDDRRQDADRRFDPEPDLVDRPVPFRTGSAPARPARVRHAEVDRDDEEDEPTTWL